VADDCLFCRIVAGETPADIVYSDESAIAVVDTNPQAPTHLLVIPREHFDDIGEIGVDAGTAAGWVAAIGAAARGQGLAEYRTVCNTGASTGQSVFHLHAHVLGGRLFRWPPG
jgi:histidine triad (HIT) family protein